MLWRALMTYELWFIILRQSMASTECQLTCPGYNLSRISHITFCASKGSSRGQISTCSCSTDKVNNAGAEIKLTVSSSCVDNSQDCDDYCPDDVGGSLNIGISLGSITTNKCRCQKDGSSMLLNIQSSCCILEFQSNSLLTACDGCVCNIDCNQSASTDLASTVTIPTIPSVSGTLSTVTQILSTNDRNSLSSPTSSTTSGNSLPSSTSSATSGNSLPSSTSSANSGNSLPSSASSPDSRNPGLIAGVVVGVTVVIALLVAALAFLILRWRRQKSNNIDSTGSKASHEAKAGCGTRYSSTLVHPALVIAPYDNLATSVEKPYTSLTKTPARDNTSGDRNGEGNYAGLYAQINKDKDIGRGEEGNTNYEDIRGEEGPPEINSNPYEDANEVIPSTAAAADGGKARLSVIPEENETILIDNQLYGHHRISIIPPIAEDNETTLIENDFYER